MVEKTPKQLIHRSARGKIVDLDKLKAGKLNIPTIGNTVGPSISVDQQTQDFYSASISKASKL